MDEENPEEDLGITTLDESQIEQLKKNKEEVKKVSEKKKKSKFHES